LQIFCKQPVKGNLHIFSFSSLKIRLFKILQNFLHILNGMVKGFPKMYNFSFFSQTFLLYNLILRKKKLNFCKFANFFADSKSRAQELSNDVYHLSYLDIKHGISSISWFSSTPAGIGLREQKTNSL